MKSSFLPLIAACCALAVTAQAQNYPTKPIRIIVPFVPAGPTDNQARWAAQQLTAALGQQVIVDNRPGAGGVPGTEAVVRSAPDGYTLLAGNPGPLTIAPSVRAQMPYDPLRDLAPIALIARSASCVCLHPSLPAKNVKEFVALAKAQPGKINYGSPGVGTVGHFATELFAFQSGVKLNHIPYKGAAQYTVDLIAGNIELAINQFAIATPYVNAGKLRCLGATSRERSPLLPNVPTIAEQGIKDFESYNWNGVLAPAGTPPAIISRIADIIAKQLATPEAKALYSGQGHEASGITTTAYADFLKAETEKWAKIAKVANIPKQ
ncbi:MAG: tripartite tricarboxylate transporter substrate binding protein [Burkholderiales bacterium]|nr:tripartite tricarboxylate transporter substrate binding protein [Burkholderiales bacterium]